jgi:hypothetical protein
MALDIYSIVNDPIARKVGGTILGYWTFSAAADALPQPTPQAHPLLVFLYKFVQTFAGNLKRVSKALHIPGAEPENQ